MSEAVYGASCHKCCHAMAHHQGTLLECKPCKDCTQCEYNHVYQYFTKCNLGLLDLRAAIKALRDGTSHPIIDKFIEEELDP